MEDKRLFILNVFSKNLFFNHPYQITYFDEKITFYKIKLGKSVYRFHFLVKLYSIIRWLTKLEKNSNTIKGFSVKIKTKNKTFISKDYEGLLRLKIELSCKCSFANFTEFYSEINEINKGMSRKVWHAQCKANKTDVAVKYINKKDLVPLNYSVLEQEIQIMLKLRGYKQFVQIHDIYQDDQHYLIVMDYLKGNSLSHYIDTYSRLGQKLSMTQVFTIMKRLFAALLQLHHLQIIHRDIKPQNLLLAEPNDINSLTIIDFGFATYTNINRYLLYKCGTPGYAAPEVLNSNCTYYSYSCDVFSSGCVFYQMLIGELPFQGSTIQEIVHNNRICQIEMKEKFKYGDENSGKIIEILQSLLQKDASSRIDTEAGYEQFKILSMIYQYNETEDCHDSTPIINQLPILDTKIGKVFEQSSTTRLSLPSSAQFMAK